jgi:hypothetical protein
MEKKMLREIANDNQTPKKRDLPLYNDLYERMDNDEDDNDLSQWDTDGPVPLAEF